MSTSNTIDEFVELDFSQQSMVVELKGGSTELPEKMYDTGYTCVVHFISGTRYFINCQLNQLTLADISDIILEKIVKKYNHDVQFFTINTETQLPYETILQSKNEIDEFSIIVINDVQQTYNTLKQHADLNLSSNGDVFRLNVSRETHRLIHESFFNADKYINNVIRFLIKNPSCLKTMVIKYRDQSEYTDVLFKNMLACDKTQKLNIENFNSDKPLSKDLLEYLNQNVNLEDLYLNDFYLNETDFITFFDALTNNDTMSLKYINIKGHGFQHFNVFAQSLIKFDSLNGLKINYCNINDNHIKLLSEVLNQNTKLKILDLQKNRSLTNNCIQYITTILLNNKNIRIFRISLYKNVNEGFNNIINMVQTIIQYNNTNDNINKSSLDEIALEYNSSEDISEERIEEVFFTCYNLGVRIYFFDLKNNIITDESLGLH